MAIKSTTNNLMKFKSLRLSCLIIFLCLLISKNALAQNDNYERYLDSAKAYEYTDQKLTFAFLDSIPDPERNIKSNMGDYYLIRAEANDRLNNLVDSHKEFLLAIKHNELEGNYDDAARACLNLMTQNYQLNKNDEALIYLEKAKEFYKKTNNTDGLLEIKLIPAEIEFYAGEYKESNSLLLKNLSLYKNNDNKFLYTLATYMLTSNYIKLKDLKEAKYHFKKFEKLENANGVTDFSFFEGVLHMEFASYYNALEKVDSALVYLNKATSIKNEMEHVSRKNYYRIFSNVYKLKGDTEKYIAYTDSLVQFTESVDVMNLEASFENTEELLEKEENLVTTKETSQLRQIIALLLGVGLIAFVFFFYQFRKAKKAKEEKLEEKLTKSTSLNTNQEKLSAKVNVLEAYITDQKADIKRISKTSDITEQRKQILDLHKKVHIESQNVLAVGEDQLTVINELNVDFFNNLKEKHPKLNEADSLICYYLFMGFKNKDIALMLNLTVRSIESKRYRLIKKMNINKEEMTLSEYIESKFKGD